MAQFNYLNELNSLTTMDGPLTRGPLQRWVKKGTENMKANQSLKNSTNLSLSCNQSMQKLSISSNQSNTSLLSANKTPTRSEKKSKTPSKTKSPGRSKTPTPSKNKTPNKADRFIPSRSNTNYDLCHYMMNQQQQNKDEESTDQLNNEPQKAAMQRALAESLGNNAVPGERLLQYTCKAPAAPEGYQNKLRVVYSQAKVPSSVKATSRYIPQAPDRILDAPDIIDDYYLNLLDWSASNVVAVALGGAVYLWNAGSGSILQLMSLTPPEHVCSLAWMQAGGPHIAIGTAHGTTEIWDCERVKRVRVMDGHNNRVGSLGWNQHVVSSGCRAGRLVHHDVRAREHNISTIQAHSQEICGLKWSPEGRYLATGGNDNLLNVWPAVQGNSNSVDQPLHTFSEHQAAVKGVAWCPWSSGILASGGGTADRTIRIWNVNTGLRLNVANANSQVCSIVWSTHYKELISGHGYANNQLIIWKYPMLTKISELNGHTSRVLSLALSPDGTTVISVGADETIRVWKCFMIDPAKKETGESKAAKSLLKVHLR